MRASHPISNHWLLVDGATAFGGHEVMLMRFVEELARQGRVLPHVLAREGTRLRTRSAQFATPMSLTRISTHGRPSILDALRDGYVFMRAAINVRPSLCVVAEGCLLAQPLFTAVARLMGVRVVVYTPLVDSGATMGFRRGKLRDWIVCHGYANLPHAWITITQQQAGAFAAWAAVKKPVFTLPNTVDRAIEQLAVSHQSSRAAQEEAGVVRVLVLGRLDAHQKGLDLLLDFLECATALAGRVRVTLAGEGDFRGEVERRTLLSPLLSRLLRAQAWSDPLATLMQHDVLLLPSRFEGVPLVMLEAMALGVPVVASDLPGTRTYLGADTLFPIADLSRAFDIVLSMQDSARRRAVVQRNREAFDAGASGRAFSTSVTALTEQLLRIGESI